MTVIWVTKLSILPRVAASIFHEPLLYGRTRIDPREPNIKAEKCIQKLFFKRLFNPSSSLICVSTITHLCLQSIQGGLVAQIVRNLPAMPETQVRFLGQEDPLEKEMATHSSILAWTEESGELDSMRSQRVGHDWVTNTFFLRKLHSEGQINMPKYLGKRN